MYNLSKNILFFLKKNTSINFRSKIGTAIFTVLFVAL